MQYEYIAIPAPVRGKQGKGQKTAVERLASAMTDILNEMAEDHWEYLRTETLTIEDKPHRLSKLIERIETVLVFRRPFEFEEVEEFVEAEPIVTKASPAKSQYVEPEVAAPPRAVLQRSEPLDDEIDERPVAPSLGGARRD